MIRTKNISIIEKAQQNYTVLQEERTQALNIFYETKNKLLENIAQAEEEKSVILDFIEELEKVSYDLHALISEDKTTLEKINKLIGE